MSSWLNRLSPASFCGIPFGVVGSEQIYGRRLAVHLYPFRDAIWVEDLGREGRRIALVGFLIDNSLLYGGGDVLVQRERLVAAVETKGEGTLIHPTLGRLTVAVHELRVVDKRDAGGYFELCFSFIEAGRRVFPTLVRATRPAVLAGATAVDRAAAAIFGARAAADLKNGAAVARRVATAAAFWARRAQALADDATNLRNVTGRLSGPFGRYHGGRTRGGFAAATGGIQSQAATVLMAVNAASVARNHVAVAATALTGAGDSIGP
jgi:prophage DNA circulation protein